MTLTLKNVSCRGLIPRWLIRSVLVDFSYEFKFGRSYLLDSPVARGAWALSWIIAGLLNEDSGIIEKDGEPFDLKARRQISWVVREDEIKRFGRFHMTIKSQVQHGFSRHQTVLGKSHENVIKQFFLSPSRYIRPMRQLSNEGWSASCAIGFVNSKSIFCFPHMDYARRGFINEYRELWFEDHLNFLKSTGALILLPAHLTPESEGLCDEVISL
jgi:hypothetical protein